MTQLAYDYPLLNVLFTTMWVFLWIMWLFLLVRVFMDLFRNDRLSGWAKAAWCLFVLVLPFVGVLVYLVAQGRGMGEREAQQAQMAEQEVREYIQEAAAGAEGPSQAEQLAKLAELKDHGDISEEEYQRAKNHVLAA